MNIKNLFSITLTNPPCISGIDSDDLYRLANAMEVSVTDDKFSGFVRSTYGTNVKFNFGSDGNFAGVTARVNSKNVILIHGVGSKELSVFQGPPSNINPGEGWQIEPDLSRKYLNQSGAESGWEIFFASRVAVINNP